MSKRCKSNDCKKWAFQEGFCRECFRKISTSASIEKTAQYVSNKIQGKPVAGNKRTTMVNSRQQYNSSPENLKNSQAQTIPPTSPVKISEQVHAAPIDSTTTTAGELSALPFPTELKQKRLAFLRRIEQQTSYFDDAITGNTLKIENQIVNISTDATAAATENVYTWTSPIKKNGACK